MGKTVIQADKSFSLEFRSLFQYKDLFLTLSYRDFKVKYAQTFLGFLWAILQPVVMLLIFTLIFGKVVKVDTGEIPYPLFVIVGMTGWTYFSNVISQSGNSLIASQEMVKKVYFPRFIIPLSKVYVSLIDLLITLVLVLGLLLIYQVSISASIVLMPLFILFILLVAVGFGAWFSALSIRYRDVQHAIPFVVQLGMYASPVVYPSSLLIESTPEWVRILYYLNPAAGTIEALRWSILGDQLNLSYVAISFVAGILVFVTGYIYFHKVENSMADLI